VQNWVADLAEEKQSEKETIREKALEMRAEGKTQEEVAGEIGVDQATVSRWEYASVKNLTSAYTENANNQSSDMEKSNEDFELDESCKDGQENDENDQEKEFPESDTAQELDLVKAIIGCRIETHYGTVGIVDEVIGPFEDGFYTIVYKHPVDGKKCWINSITGKDNTVLCEGVPLKITDALAEKKPVPEIKTTILMEETEPPTGRHAAESYRKKLLPYSDMVKEYYQQLKKTSELAEQLVNRREDLIEAIAGMEADGMSITVLANAVVQACDIYFPRLSEARDVLEEAIKRGVKGVMVKDKFVVVTGGKKNGG
jgi:transcriptional regulator with XRE-family HTH domain